MSKSLLKKIWIGSAIIFVILILFKVISGLSVLEKRRELKEEKIAQQIQKKENHQAYLDALDKKRRTIRNPEVITIPQGMQDQISGDLDEFLLTVEPGGTAKIPTFGPNGAQFSWEVMSGEAWISVLFDKDGKIAPKGIDPKDRSKMYTIQYGWDDAHIGVSKTDYKKFVFLLVHNPADSNCPLDFRFKRLW